MNDYVKINSKRYPDIVLRVVPGHFVTPNSHINKYVDMTAMMRRQSEAKAVARAMAEYYNVSTKIDTIICMDGTEIIGAYLADDLTKAGVLSTNAHKTMYITAPEYDLSGQMIFRENTIMMVRNKKVLVVLASATTGRTISRAVESINYYGGEVVGISAIFSAVSAVAGLPVFSIFDRRDVPDYEAYRHRDCPMCRKGIKVDAICNGFGYSPL